MSFQQGVSGINAAARNLEVISNNIANANTVGAKLSRAEFADMYANAASLQWGRDEPGMGVRVAAITQQFTQGGIRATENPLDAAINGSGFFVLGAADGSEVYTRNGQFQLDNLGFIVNSSGMRLQGYPIDTATGVAGGVPGAINLPVQGIAPRVTSTIGTQLNLDGRVEYSATQPPFSLSEIASYSGSSSVPVFDAQGNEQVLSMYYRRTSNANEWEVYAALNGTAVPAPAPGSPQEPLGRLAFHPDGTLDGTRSGNLLGGAIIPGPLSLALPFASATLSGAAGAPVTVDFAGSTQWGTRFGVTAMSQDGYSAGQLSGFTIAADGTVEARYSNGKTLGTARIALADFRNPQGLAAVGGNLYRYSPASGPAAVGQPGTGNLGVLQGSALEESNIDITQQLVAMIEAQRAYQANAQSIKTQDQVQSIVANLR
jgi:flagellar hook protein FlgE